MVPAPLPGGWRTPASIPPESLGLLLPSPGTPPTSILGPMKRPDALFLDIDGTILRSDHSLSPRVYDAITALRKAGTVVCLATGRSWEAVKPLYDQLGLDGPTVCYNGGFLVGGADGELLEEIDLDEGVGRRAIALAREKNMEIVAFRHAQLVYEAEGPFIRGYHTRTGLKGNLVDFDAYDRLEFTKAIIISEHEKLLPVKSLLESEFGPEVMSITFSAPTFLEMMGGGVDKGRGLRDVCRLTGIDVAGSVAMGDGWNDLALLEAAGDAWVMGSASDDLKARFPENRRALDSDADGAAIVMEAMLRETEVDKEASPS